MRSTTELAIQKRLRDKGLNKEEICKQTGITSERLEKLEKGKAKRRQGDLLLNEIGEVAQLLPAFRRKLERSDILEGELSRYVRKLIHAKPDLALYG